VWATFRAAVTVGDGVGVGLQSRVMDRNELNEVRKIALGLPGVTEGMSHRSPCFYVQNKKPVCYFHETSRSSGRPAIWCPFPSGVNREMAESEPERFFEPTPSASGVFGNWLGVYLDTSVGHEVDWTEIAVIIDRAFRHVAPKRLIAQLDEQ